MRKIEVYVSTGYVGSRKAEVIEVEDDMSDDDIDEVARECMFSMIEWSWRDADEGKRKK